MTTEFTLHLDRTLEAPLQLQLVQKLKSAINGGQLAPGARLPSSRGFSETLGVSRIVVLNAYDQLQAEGYLETRHGEGSFVSDSVTATPPPQAVDYRGPEWLPVQPAPTASRNWKYDFSLGGLTEGLLHQTDWKRAWRRALNNTRGLDQSPPEGLAPLRQAVADHVRRYRGIACEAEEVIITSGVASSLDLIARICRPADPVIYLENPCFKAAHAAFRRYDHAVRLQEIDSEGIRLDGLDTPQNQPSILFCTPSHQFPMGPRLSLRRRLALLDWARERDALILEDDYDSEFRYGVTPLPSLKAQDSAGHVVYLSSLSKSLSPSIRLGYIIAPQSLRHALIREIGINHGQPPALVQQAVAEFMGAGDMDRHLRRLRRHYETLNRIVRKGLQDLSPEIEVMGLEAGIHCFLKVNARPLYDRLKTALRENDIYLPALDNFRHGPTQNRGFALGYGHFREAELEAALEVLLKTIKREH